MNRPKRLESFLEVLLAHHTVPVMLQDLGADLRKHFTGEKLGNSRRDYTIGIYPMLKDQNPPPNFYESPIFYIKTKG